MKKILSLILAVCMLMGAAAFAEEPVMYQDEQPPMVVTETNEAGETIVARILDAQGNELAQIKDDGSLVLTDTHFRADVEDEEISHRLTSAYEGVMDDVHHSDVECKLHEHDVKVDINTILTSLQQELDAHDLVMYELYDVKLSGEAADLLAQEGNKLEVTFELKEEQWLPTIVLYSEDGLEWQVIQHEDTEDMRFTVQLPASGTLALLIDGQTAFGLGEPRQIVTVIPSDPDEGNDNFTPSASGKPNPDVITTVVDDETVIGYIYNNEGTVKIPVPDQNFVLVTPLSGRDYVVDIQTHEHLEWAYDSICEAEDIGELYTEHDMSTAIPADEHTTIAEQLDEHLALLDSELTHDKLVVRDLFELTAYGEYVHYLYDPEYYLEMTFDANLDPSKPMIVIHSMDSVHWHVHPLEESQVHADGSVTLKLYDLGVVAFLVEGEENINLETAVLSPN